MNKQMGSGVKIHIMGLLCLLKKRGVPLNENTVGLSNIVYSLTVAVACEPLV